jgi:hypothetical protein
VATLDAYFGFFFKLTNSPGNRMNKERGRSTKHFRESEFWLGFLERENVALSMFSVDHLGKGSSYSPWCATQLRETNKHKKEASVLVRGNNKKISTALRSGVHFLRKWRIRILAWFSNRELVALNMFTVDHLGKGSSYPQQDTFESFVHKYKIVLEKRNATDYT